MRDDEKRGSQYEDPADGLFSEPGASDPTYSRYPPPVSLLAIKLALAAFVVAVIAAAVALALLLIELA